MLKIEARDRAQMVVFAVSPDRTAFTVSYSQHLAQTGVGTRPTDFRKNCQLGLDVHIPPGFTYAITEADHHGYAHLAPGATGSETASGPSRLQRRCPRRAQPRQAQLRWAQPRGFRRY